MKIIVVNSHGIIPWLIKLITFSKWNHSAIYIEEEGLVFESDIKPGVRSMTLEEFLVRYPNNEIIEVWVPNPRAAADFVKAQLGKPYDWTAIFSFLLRRNWQEDDKWFCSELVEATILAGGLKRFRDSTNRITPYLNWVAM